MHRWKHCQNEGIYNASARNFHFHNSNMSHSRRPKAAKLNVRSGVEELATASTSIFAVVVSPYNYHRQNHLHHEHHHHHQNADHNNPEGSMYSYSIYIGLKVLPI